MFNVQRFYIHLALPSTCTVVYPSIRSSTHLYLVADASFSLALRLTDAVSKPSESEFWEEAKKSEKTLQDYVPRLLKSAAAYFKSTKFTDIISAMDGIVRATATFRDSIRGALDAHHISLDALTLELAAIFITIVDDLEKITPKNKTPSHAEREEMVDKILNDTEVALTNLTMRYGIEENITTTYLQTLRPQVHAVVASVGMSISPCAMRVIWLPIV